MSLLRALREADALRPIDDALARTLQRLAPDTPDAVLAAAALASLAVSKGHAGLALDAPEELLESDAVVAWPDPAQWHGELAGSRWIATPGDSTEASDPGQPLVLEPAFGKHGLLYLRRYREYERRLAAGLHRIGAHRPNATGIEALGPLFGRLFPDARAGHDRQARAAALALRHALLLVTGGPGTGKTTTIARLLVLLAAQAAGTGATPPRIALAAPTGRAAERMAESVRGALAGMRDAGIGAGLVDALPATGTTLHRLLGTIPDSPGFRHDADNPLPLDVVVVDEASMVDLPLMAKLVEAVPDGARLVLLGDPDQLPSVEAGDVLAAILQAAGPGDALARDDAEVLSPLLGAPPGRTGDASARQAGESSERHPREDGGPVGGPVTAMDSRLRGNDGTGGAAGVADDPGGTVSDGHTGDASAGHPGDAFAGDPGEFSGRHPRRGGGRGGGPDTAMDSRLRGNDGTGDAAGVTDDPGGAVSDRHPRDASAIHPSDASAGDPGEFSGRHPRRGGGRGGGPATAMDSRLRGNDGTGDAAGVTDDPGGAVSDRHPRDASAIHPSDAFAGDPGEFSGRHPREGGGPVGGPATAMDSRLRGNDGTGVGGEGGRFPGRRVHLVHGHRQHGGLQLAPLADAVRAGDADAALALLRNDTLANVHFHDGPADPLATHRDELLDHWRAVADAASPAAALAQAGRLRLLTALREGPQGANGINARIEDLLAGTQRPGGRDAGPHFHGRLLLVTENSYAHRLFNGDIGICFRDAQGALMAWFPGETPDAPRPFHPAALPAHRGAFAMTVHKAQGSEFDTVWLVLPSRPNRVLSRELVYTGLTRARRVLHVAGNAQVLQAALSRHAGRWSGLGWRLG
ncbi:hypothetical protein GCM10028862_23120 [Luteimonas pelagia]